jgi:nucleoside-diphosphate-sugar epimerase
VGPADATPVRVLVTGGSGFIGSHLSAALLTQGCSVRATYRHEPAAVPGVEWHRLAELDVAEQWPPLLAEIDAVVHLAALVHQGGSSAERRWAEFERINVAGTRALARACRTAGVRRLVFLSSISVYGRGSQRLDEQAPLAPQDDYGRSKLLAERALEEELSSATTEWCILRPPLIYGRDAPGNMPRLQRLVASGLPLPFGAVRNRRSLMCVDNLVDAVITVLRFAGEIRGAYVLSDGSDFATPELLRVLAVGSGRRLRLLAVPVFWLRALGHLGDALARGLCVHAVPSSREIDSLVGSLCVDSTRFRQSFAWRPPLGGIEALVASYGARRSLNAEAQ